VSAGRFQVRPAQVGDWPAWAALRVELWPDCETEMADLRELIDADDSTCLLAFDADGEPVGLAEASLRHDYVNGTSSSPVGFLEGWFVHEPLRGTGIGRQLIDAVAQWARNCGCSELASDTGLDNHPAQAAHAACGFTETERVVYYRMPLVDAR
jgi:aminoglycoside 6'-N-acetyltransferase I